MEPRLGVRGIPRAEFIQPTGVTGADQQDVALADRYTLTALGGLEVFAEDVFSGLKPGHAPSAGHVKQDTASDQSVLQDSD